MRTRTSQKEQILEFMRTYGVITPLIAFKRFRICALSQRCQELERDGHVLSKIWIQRHGKRYRGYSLIEAQRKAA